MSQSLHHFVPGCQHGHKVKYDGFLAERPWELSVWCHTYGNAQGDLSTQRVSWYPTEQEAQNASSAVLQYIHALPDRQ